MRVIAGTLRGRKLMTLEGMDVRPTTDKVKEAIFSAIQFDLYESTVLDLFAGSGQMGIEALSRGAAEAVFVDMSAKSLQTVKTNIAALQLEQQSVCFQANAIDFLKSDTRRYHLAFLDPPYRKGLIEAALPELAEKITAGGKVICEHEAELILPDEIATLRVKKRYKYGKIHVTVYINKEEDMQNE